MGKNILSLLKYILNIIIQTIRKYILLTEHGMMKSLAFNAIILYILFKSSVRDLIV
jgi:hypothetical protein